MGRWQVSERLEIQVEFLGTAIIVVTYDVCGQFQFFLWRQDCIVGGLR